MRQVLARTRRPRSFSAVIGQPVVVRALQNALSSKRLHHAYVLTGTRGVGKTTLGRILAACLNCEQGVVPEPCGTCASCQALGAGHGVDLVEIDAASRAKVEDTRALLEQVPYAPIQGRYTVYFIDEVHMFSSHSFNALLKTLEEPPSHVVFLLATTAVDKIPDTVLSRCMVLRLQPVSSEVLSAHVMTVAQEEGRVISPEASQLLAEAGEGSVRDALSLLEQVLVWQPGEVSASDVATVLGRVSSQAIWGLYDHLCAPDPQAVHQILQTWWARDVDPEQVLKQVQSAWQQVAWAQWSGATGVLRERANAVSPAWLQRGYRAMVDAWSELPWVQDKRLPVEMCCLRIMTAAPEISPPSQVQPPAEASATATATETESELPPVPPPVSEPVPEVEAPVTRQPDPLEPKEPAGEPAASVWTDPQHWVAVCQRVPADACAAFHRALLQHTVVLELADDVLQLGLTGHHAKLMALNPGRLRELAAVWAQALHDQRSEWTRIAVRLIDELPDGIQTPWMHQQAQDAERQLAYEQVFASDPTVEAVRRLCPEARLTADSVRPLDDPNSRHT